MDEHKEIAERAAAQRKVRETCGHGFLGLLKRNEELEQAHEEYLQGPPTMNRASKVIEEEYDHYRGSRPTFWQWVVPLLVVAIIVGFVSLVVADGLGWYEFPPCDPTMDVCERPRA